MEGAGIAEEIYFFQGYNLLASSGIFISYLGILCVFSFGMFAMKLFLLVLGLSVLALVALMHFFPQINFRSMPPALCEGKLDVQKPNWVSSQVASADKHYVEPLHFSDLEALAVCIKRTLPSVTLTQLSSTRLIAYRQSKVFNFVDWICIQSNGSVSSSATLGYSDFGKNRQLVEQIRMSCSGKCGEPCS